MSLFYNDFLCQRATLMQLHEIMQSMSVGMPAAPRRDQILCHYFEKILRAPFRLAGLLHVYSWTRAYCSFSWQKKS